MPVRRLVIELNGTDSNPYKILGLKQNPFPAIATAEASRGVRALQSLAGEPIQDEDDIRSRLRGMVTDELLELCIKKFVPGERVKFTVYWEE